MTAERTCVVEKGPNGYGFHLHSEKSRTGQFVRLVEPGSAAEKSGLRAGDRLIRVCGEDVRELTHQQVVSKIRAATEKLVLEVEGSEEMSQEKPQVVEEPTESVAERVNGESMLGKQHADVVSAIKTGGDETTLLVVDPETDKYFQECHVTPGREHLTGPLPEKVANGSIEKEEISDAPLETDAPSDSPVSSPELLPIDMSPQESQKDISDSGPVPNTDPVPDAATLDLNMSLAVAKERAHQKRSQKKAPTMDWSKRKEVFSSL
ncbi:Na(+)/H(+) exchange regulatory cofactor NHE-RF1 isoform X2 [Hyla sarda]|uniref:Na(+)/H(+) exchange regulatory cofactor NHE-RF1 isoform X2 n=1 Tax=Hyla sarda TaxID=327740 RepID=UPI0024C2E5BE|nr:Na(+)/H(+) exchange regulatory cofactor NHE-RF1 isoform X2 [Hyla sarda]